jgi:hypothetical protein
VSSYLAGVDARELALGAPDPADAVRRAEQFLDAAAQTELDLGQLTDDARSRASARLTWRLC